MDVPTIPKGYVVRSHTVDICSGDHGSGIADNVNGDRNTAIIYAHRTDSIRHHFHSHRIAHRWTRPQSLTEFFGPPSKGYPQFVNKHKDGWGFFMAFFPALVPVDGLRRSAIIYYKFIKTSIKRTVNLTKRRH